MSVITEGMKQWDRDVLLRDVGHTLAMLGLQSKQYETWPDFRDAVDAVLALTGSSVCDTADG